MIERIKSWWATWRKQTTCDHRWHVEIEYYPYFTQDYWSCERCDKWQAFENSEPPVKLKTEICSLGHVHIVN